MSSSKSKSKSTASHASHTSTRAPISPAAQPASASSASPDAQGVVAATPADLTTQAARAVAALQALSSNLPIDDALPPKALLAARVSNRVPLGALRIAANILGANPALYPQFDATDAQASIDYEQAMGPVATNARNLADRIDKSILKRRSKNATQTLALYGTLKAVSRLPASESTRGQVKQLTKLLVTYKKPRASKVTKKEIAGVAKGMRRGKVAQAKAAAAAVASEAATEAATAAGIAPTQPPASPDSPAGATAPQAAAAAATVTKAS